MNRKLLSIVILLFASANIYAQDEIETDRPDQTETSATVPAGRFQMENGFQHTQSRTNGSDLMLPTSLSKFGINDILEVRLITELAFNKVSDSTSTGLEPITVGFKVNLWKENGIIPETSIIAQVQLPKVASKNLRKEHVAPEIQLLFENTINDNLSIGYNLDAQWDGESTNPGYEYTFSPSYKLSDKLKTYIESFGYMLSKRHVDNWVDGGFIYLIKKNVQIDIAAGYELTGHNHYHQFFETLGFSFRI
jgi:hypothetical protein